MTLTTGNVLAVTDAPEAVAERAVVVSAPHRGRERNAWTCRSFGWSAACAVIALVLSRRCASRRARYSVRGSLGTTMRGSSRSWRRVGVAEATAILVVRVAERYFALVRSGAQVATICEVPARERCALPSARCIARSRGFASRGRKRAHRPGRRRRRPARALRADRGRASATRSSPKPIARTPCSRWPTALVADAVVVDGRLPPPVRRRSWRACVRLGAISRVFVVAALEETSLVRAALAAGAAGIVVRPFVAERVAASLNGARRRGANGARRRMLRRDGSRNRGHG